MSDTQFSASDSLIYLRRLVPDDVTHEYVEWLNNPIVNQYLECRYVVHTIDSVREYVKCLASEDSNEIMYGIFMNSNDTHVGNIKIGPINQKHRHAAVGLLIGNPNYWGKGIATRAIKLVSDILAPQLLIRKLYAGCYSNNIGSYKAFIKAGWLESGKIPGYWLTNEGSENDEILLSKTISFAVQLPSLTGVTLIGSGDLMVQVAKYLRDKDIAVQVLYAKRHFDEAVFKLLESFGAKVVKCYDYPDTIPDVFDSIQDYNSLCLCFGPVWIFSPKFISWFGGRIFNYNGIPIPSYLGGAHFTWQILNQSWEGGCFIQQITSDIDRGLIVKSFRYSILESIDVKPRDFELANLKYGFSFLKEFLSEVISSNQIVFSCENIDWNQLTYFPRLHTSMHGWIDWSWSGDEIRRFCLAFSDPYPGARTSIGAQDVILKSVSFVETEPVHPFCRGLIFRVNKQKGFVDVWVRDGFLRVQSILNLNTGDSVSPRLGTRFATSPDKLIMAFNPISYDQNGIKGF